MTPATAPSTNRTRRFWLFALVASLTGLRRRARAETAPQRWICTYNECEHWVYDPLHGDPDDIAGVGPIPPGIAFEDLPADWRCPVCGSPKAWFEPTDRAWKPTS